MKKILKIMMVVLMLITGTVLSNRRTKAENYLRNVSIEYDTSKVSATTKLTGEEITQALRLALKDKSGEGSHIDKNCSYLAKKNGSYYESLADSTELLNTTDKYYYVVNIEEDSGYYFDTNQLPSVTINDDPVNDIQWGSQSSTGHIYVYKEVTVNSNHAVFDIKVSPATQKVQKGTDYTFSAEVLGSVKTVKWTLSGKKSSDTFVDSNTGRVILGEDEWADVITIRATSTIRSSCYGEAEIIVTDEEVKIDKVIVSPKTATVKKGNGYSFNVTVEGTDSHEVEWSVSGNTSTDTYMSGWGTLYVSLQEKSSTVKVRATSVKDPSKYDEATVTLTEPDFIRKINAVFDKSAVALSTDKTGKQITDALRSALQDKSGDGSHVDKNCSYLVKKVDGYYVGLSDDPELLNETDEYYYVINFEEDSGYYFDISQLPEVTFNNEAVDYVEWGSQSSTGHIYAYKRAYIAKYEKPKLVSIYNSANGADIRFDLVEGQDTYYLMQKYNGTWSALKEITLADGITKAGSHYKAFDTSIKDSYGKGYIYSIAIKDAEGNYLYNTKGLALYRLKQPTIKSVKSSSKGQATLTWTKESCHGYEVQYSLDGKNWTKAPQITSGSTTTQTISGLTSGKKYYFRIRCQKTNADRGTTWSQYSTNSSVKVK